MIDNSCAIAAFCPEKRDGDTFIYTELRDRSKQSGKNGHRLHKTFYHRSVGEFHAQWPNIKALCDLLQIRAYTRLAPRSFKSVGKQFVRMVMEAGMTDNFAGMKSLYSRACGTATPIEKLWMYDIDVLDDRAARMMPHLERLGVLRASIPSKTGTHLIVKPFDTRLFFMHSLEFKAEECTLLKEATTNLYIPDGAA